MCATIVRVIVARGWQEVNNGFEIRRNGRRPFMRVPERSGFRSSMEAFERLKFMTPSASRRQRRPGHALVVLWYLQLVYTFYGQRCG